ncbi:tautomerase family protein [Paraburkholderia sp. C35]|uniref:tautomerase family protein n=1 Tax=Paraburkholderia sp. C35 TaxID=2126993 RepID=UPI000D689CCE|nr:tautomerase family protein [Paraburkholderia sp. C35]
MPTYTVEAAAGRLSKDMKQRIAAGITRAHSEATGAQGFFAQVIFREIPEGDHFLGGAPLQSDQIFVSGHIRAGRTVEQKKQLLSAIVKVVEEVAETKKRYIWVYLSDIAHSQMVEFGQVLPEPGTESQWLQSMASEDRDYLLSIG